MIKSIEGSRVNDTVFSDRYNENCTALATAEWYDVRPFSTTIWINSIAEVELNGYWHCIRECHLSMIIEYWPEGRCEYEVNGKTHVIEPGTLCITWQRNPRLVLRSHNNERARKIRVTLGGGALLSIVEMLNPKRENIFHLTAEQQSEFVRKVNSLMYTMKHRAPEAAAQHSLASYDFLLFIFSVCNRVQGSEREEISRAIRFMVNCREQVRSVSHLADICGISVTTLNRLFRDRFGKSPKQYWDKIRFGHAAKALATSDLPVKEVGFDNGFGNPLYFSTAFKKHFGVSPSEFRRLAREGKIKPAEIDMDL